MEMKEKRIESFDDLSNERGFQFEFFCENCRKSFRSEFVASKQYHSEKRKRNAGAAASFIGNLLGGVASNVGNKIDEGLNTINDHTDDSRYDKEKEAAVLKAQAEAQKYLHQCRECGGWFCDDCYISGRKLCKNCNEARIEREREEREENGGKPKKNGVTICPKCGEEIPKGMKFCGNCGTKIEAVKICPKCKKENKPEMQFCGYCGTKLK